MKPQEIRALDPHWAAEVGIAESSNSVRDLHATTTRFNELVDEIGFPQDSDAPIFDYLEQYLTLERKDEAFFKATLMPVHDAFTRDGDVRVVSRFLVIDTRNPFRQHDQGGDPFPYNRMRSYFLMIGSEEWMPDDPGIIFPYYVVSEQEMVAAEPAHETSYLCYARYDGNMPLDTGILPQRVYDMQFHDAMAAEMQRAISNLQVG